MRHGKDINNIKVEPSSYVVGQMTTHTFTFVTPVPIYDDFKIYVQIPDDCEPPMESRLKCQGQSPLETVLDCRISG